MRRILIERLLSVVQIQNSCSSLTAYADLFGPFKRFRLEDVVQRHLRPASRASEKGLTPGRMHLDKRTASQEFPIEPCTSPRASRRMRCIARIEYLPIHSIVASISKSVIAKTPTKQRELRERTRGGGERYRNRFRDRMRVRARKYDLQKFCTRTSLARKNPHFISASFSVQDGSIQALARLLLRAG